MRTAAMASAMTVLAAGALADPTAQVNLAGVQIRNATNQTRTSSPDSVDAGCSYQYSVNGTVRGRGGGIFQLLYPNATPLAQILETFEPGSSAMLNGSVTSPNGGEHPVTLMNQTFSGSTTILGSPASVTLTLNVSVDASNFLTFNVTNVTISPAGTLGYFEFVTGTATVTSSGGCPADFNGDCFVDFFDYDDYVACFETGTCPANRTADFNGDGFADFFDYDDFVQAFESGC